jgi:hypothetical protein
VTAQEQPPGSSQVSVLLRVIVGFIGMLCAVVAVSNAWTMMRAGHAPAPAACLEVAFLVVVAWGCWYVASGRINRTSFRLTFWHLVSPPSVAGKIFLSLLQAGWFVLFAWSVETGTGVLVGRAWSALVVVLAIGMQWQIWRPSPRLKTIIDR